MACNAACRRSGLPVNAVLELVQGEDNVEHRHGVDNDATRIAVKNGASQALCYIRREQKVSLSFLRDVFCPHLHQCILASKGKGCRSGGRRWLASVAFNFKKGGSKRNLACIACAAV